MEHSEELSSKPDNAKLKLTKIQAQLRNTEEIRKITKIQSQHLISYQEKEIKLLKQEHEDLTHKINATKTKSSAEKYRHVVQEIKQLIAAKEDYEHLIKKETNYLIKLDNQIKVMEEQIVNQKKANKLKCSKRVCNAETAVRRLHDQLQHVRAKWGMLVIQKDKEKEIIKDLRLKKCSFYQLHQRMLQELQHLKKANKKVTGQILSVQKQRKGLMASIKALKEQAAIEFTAFDLEIETANRKLDHENKILKFIENKLFNPFVLERKNESLKRGAMAEEERLKAKLDTIKHYQDGFKILTTLTGHEDLDAILDHLTKREIKNFGDFTYLIVLFSKVEMLTHDIQVLKDNITSLNMQRQNLLDKKENHRKELEEKIQKTLQDARNYEDKFIQSCTVVDKWISAVDRLFRNINCELTPFIGKLKARDFLNLDNLTYFQTIESQVNLFLQAHTYLALKDKHDDEITINFLLGFSDFGTKLPPPIISPPKITENIVSTDDTPLGYEELKKIALANIIQKEKIATKREQETHVQDRK